ncbi:5-hydroxytryptamine receptor 2A [Antennarius striatus]|uniref:5-hydroxytryptamine receptor 2A n=1 Tax=Antennarius striatus TaxID=241820 RepID=UPI0035B4C080
MEPAADGQRPLLHTPPSTVPDSMDVAVGNGSQWGSGAAAGEFEDPPGNVSAWWCCSTSGNGSHAGRVLEAPPTEKNWAALLVLAVVAVTITGNLLVIVAVSLEKKLQSATNYFLMSLAVADMLLGILVMPVSMVTVLYDYGWPLPPVLCPLWIYLDVLFSTASIMHLCAISLDRYLGIRHPLRHSRSSPRSRARLKITAVWTISMGVSAPVPVLGLLDRSTVFRGGSCLLTDELFVLVGSLVAFFLPLGIMGVSYFLTIHALQQEPPPCLERLVARPKWSGTLTLSFLPQSSLSSVGWGGVGGDRGGVYGRRSLQSVSNERRASKVLGVVFLLFVVMWAPFFITNVLAVVCDPPACDAGLMGALLNVFVWVGYLSSAVNPLVYTLFNRTYRAAFLRFVRCRYRPRPQKTPLQLMLVHTLPPMTYSSAELGGASTVTDREGRGFCPAGRQTDESCV